jgi:periplasmic protein TonB
LFIYFFRCGTNPNTKAGPLVFVAANAATNNQQLAGGFMYATDYLQLSAQQSVKPNKVGPVLVTLGAHAALIAMLAIGLKVFVPANQDKGFEIIEVPTIEKPALIEPSSQIAQGPTLFLPSAGPEPVIVIEQPPTIPQVVGEPEVVTRIEPGVVSETFTNASVVRSFEPPYPAVSRLRDEEGTVVVKIMITPYGTVGDVQLEKSSGFSRLDDAALKAVRDWKFAPARRGSQAIATWVNVPVTFVLNRR